MQMHNECDSRKQVYYNRRRVNLPLKPINQLVIYFFEETIWKIFYTYL